MVKKLFFVMAVVLAVAMPSFVMAKTAVEQATGLLQKSAGVTESTVAGPGAIVGTLINSAVGLLGVVSIVLLVYGGGMWLTAAGSPDKVGKAKKVIISTVIGIIIVGLAYAITTFVLSQLVGEPGVSDKTTDTEKK